MKAYNFLSLASSAFYRYRNNSPGIRKSTEQEKISYYEQGPRKMRKFEAITGIAEQEEEEILGSQRNRKSD